MFDFLTRLFDTTDFPARWKCGQWTDGEGWLHIISDLSIWGAYTAIPVVIGYFALKRKDIPFTKIFWLFGAFILACGSGHFLEAVIFWNPVYRLSGLVKLITAVVSWGTVIALVRVMPEAMRLPGLARLNSQLTLEMQQRERLLESERIARGEAERAGRVKDEFLSLVSHELRTPLTAILGYAQLLSRDESNPADARQAAEVIERNGRAQAQIIEDLLDMSRVTSGKMRLDVQSMDICDAIRAAIETVRPAAQAKEIHLHSVLDPHAGRVLGDPGRLQQVVWNLLSNAIKFTPKQGRVQIVLERVNSHVELHVSDTGPGIHPDFLPYVFDRFRQEDASISRQHGGLGLGLSLVKHLVEQHGGIVTVASEGGGKGSTFTVSLPLQSVQVDDRGEPRIHPHSESFSNLGYQAPSIAGLKVLVVDDEPDARSLMKRLLEEYGVTVVTAEGAEQGMQAIRQQKPDVVVSDIGMPVADGYQFIRNVRAMSDSEGGRVPAAAATAFARSEDRTRALLAGFQAHLTKPINPNELIAVVAALAGRTGRQ
jgi:signal transduction histidine kinase/ActR/RegA family two-component response regulator